MSDFYSFTPDVAGVEYAPPKPKKENIVRLYLYDRILVGGSSCKYVYFMGENLPLQETDGLNVAKIGIAVFERSVADIKDEYVCIKVGDEMRDDVRKLIETN